MDSLILAYHHCFCLFDIHFHTEVFTFSFTLSASVCNLFSFSVVIAVSSAYLKLLILLPPTETPSSSFSIILKMSSIKRLKRYGDSTHHCLVPLLISIPSEFPCSVRTTAACSQYSLAIIRTSFPSSPASWVFLLVSCGWLCRTPSHSLWNICIDLLLFQIPFTYCS